MAMSLSLTDSSASHIDNNCISIRPTSGQSTSQHLSDNNLSINTIIDEEVLPSKFEYRYALCEEG